MPRFREYPQATFIESTDAFVLDRIGVGTMYVEGLTGGDGGILVTFQGAGSPGAGDWLGSQPFPIAVTFPLNWGALFAWVLPSGLPASDATFTVFRVNLADPTGVQVGTVTIDNTGAITGNTSGETVDFPADSAMVIYCPDPAVSGLADFSIAFPGSLA